MIPLECPLCGSATLSETGMCVACENSLPTPLRPCRRCSAELPESGPWRDCCESCLLNPPAFDRCLCGFRYEFPVRELVGAFKFQADFAAGRTLARLLAARLTLAWKDAQVTPVLIPVPLHTSRLRERGFNQSALLAREISARCGLDLALRHCHRTRATHSQRGLRAGERSSNLRGAFALTEPQRVLPHVVIVDDVVTTMATVNALAQLYRKSGTRHIDVACLARVS